jgi:hypothetical protein
MTGVMFKQLAYIVGFSQIFSLIIRADACPGPLREVPAESSRPDEGVIR